MTIFSSNTDDQLQRAIKITSPEHLQRVLSQLCMTIPEAKNLIASELLVPEDKVPVPAPRIELTLEDDEDDDDGDGDDESSTEPRTPTPTTSNKRKREAPSSIADHMNPQKEFKPRYVTCIECGEEYDVPENTSTSCRYHEATHGELDVDFFGDQIDFHNVDSEENRKRYPQGCIHECCEGTTLEPCQRDFHQSVKEPGVGREYF
ncbi:uncharacterized protein BO97DRAFT_264480 [Aspergillus homomorphus CBS 101889]|uniref:C2H2-type domain-containing protein n=1 Tax=Aspergillus homomorphus (strain CBS 101889) TaxID=1450537 RepID=A0A395HI70_ASPHC|nr:hypothetical protein BO97DRAFT_264480 [Aspergillus homomorphus CBS 101889]RAL07203.1 hypothetical protein BO97DRAFT_264480 [Aspergillus homomorphus CBS 101889]